MIFFSLLDNLGLYSYLCDLKNGNQMMRENPTSDDNLAIGTINKLEQVESWTFCA